jgi:hypothetical protein
MDAPITPLLLLLLLLQMFFDDDLPVWGFVGKSERNKQQATGAAAANQQQSDLHFFLFTHFHFDIAYNGDNVIEVNVSTAASDPKKTRDITTASSLDVEFSYSVKWKPTEVVLDDRMDRYSRISFLPQHLEVRAVAGLGMWDSRGGPGGEGVAELTEQLATTPCCRCCWLHRLAHCITFLLQHVQVSCERAQGCFSRLKFRLECVRNETEQR